MFLNSIRFGGDKRKHPQREKHHFWKGGKSENAILRKATLTLINANRDMSKCEKCGSTNRRLIHHKDENRQNNNSDNLEILCHRCHIQLHKGKKMTLICKNCLKPFITIPSKLKTRRYCSRSCYSVAKSKELKGKYPKNLKQFKNMELERDDKGRFLRWINTIKI